MNLAARVGRWSAAHWKTATFGWLAFVTAAVIFGSLHGTISQTDAEQTNGQAARAEQMLAAAHVKSVASENVLVRSRTATASSPAFRRTVNDVRTTLAGTAHVRDVHLGAASKDGHLRLVGFDIRGQRRHRGRAGPAGAGRGRQARASTPRLHDRRGRRREHLEGDERCRLERAVTRRAAFAADHLRDPAARVRRLPGGRDPGACSPSRRCSPRSGSRISRARSSTRPTRPRA